MPYCEFRYYVTLQPVSLGGGGTRGQLSQGGRGFLVIMKSRFLMQTGTIHYESNLTNMRLYVDIVTISK